MAKKRKRRSRRAKKWTLTTVLRYVLWCVIAIAALWYGAKTGRFDNLLPADKGSSIPGRVDLQQAALVHFIDVGEGSSSLIQIDNINILIDAGDVEYGKDLAAYLKNEGIQEIHYCFLSHLHADHIGGMSEVMQQIQVDQIYTGELPQESIPTSAVFTELLDLIEQQNVSFSYVEMGDVFKVGGATIRVLGPAKNTYSDLNDTSLLLQFTYGKHSFLFCGDATSLEEKDVLKTGVDLSSTVLAVAHHGSNTSTSSAFLAAVNPIYAIISVGADNSYGHPHQETLQKLDQIGTQVFTTMNSGTVLFETDGTAMVYYTQKE